MSTGFSLKDHLFNAETVARLGQHFEDAGVFQARPFVAGVMAELAPLELMERVRMIADHLATHLPGDFEAAAQAIGSALPPPLDPTLSDDDFGHFIYAPLGVFVENKGIEGHVSTSLDLLEAITQRFSMEFSIRPFLNLWPGETLERMRDWVTHDHYHVRRLVSEGTRPRLPWGKAIALDDGARWPLLDALHADPTRYVTRSVANHLNDLARADPDGVIGRLQDWRVAGRQSRPELDWMTRHALRGLSKAGHRGALKHLGYDPNVACTVHDLAVTPNVVAIGETVTIAMQVHAPAHAPLMIDYVIDFVKANGSTAPKTFKLKVLKGRGAEPVLLEKKHHFKKGATTFTHYPGDHELHIQINGRTCASVPFVLSSGQ